MSHMAAPECHGLGAGRPQSPEHEDLRTAFGAEGGEGRTRARPRSRIVIGKAQRWRMLGLPGF